MSKTAVNWGIISCARIAQSAVIPGILAADNARLVAISSANAMRLKEFSRQFSVEKAYDSYDALLDDPSVDAVYIPLPNALHKEWVLRAAKQKKHILCEKPLGLTAQEAVQMKQACDDNGVLLMEAFAYLHSPLTKTVQQLVQSGAIGKLRHIESHFSFPLNNLSDIRLTKAVGGGATYDIGCYNLSIIRLLAGEPNFVHATGEMGADGVDIGSVIQLGFASGATATSYCSFASSDWSGYTVVGESGVLEVLIKFNSSGALTVKLMRGESVEQIPVNTPDNYMLEVEQFGRCIRGGERPFVSHEFSLGNARLIDEALRQIIK